MPKPVEFSEKQHRKSWLIYGGASLFSLVALAAIIAYSYVSSYRALTDLALHRRVSLSYLAAKTMEQRLSHVIEMGKFFVADLRFRQFVSGGEWQEAINIHRHGFATLPFVDRVFLANPSGVLMADIPEVPSVRGKNFSHRDWYQGVSRNWEPYVSEVYLRAAEPQVHVVSIAIPIWAKDPRVVGILVLQIQLDAFLVWSRDIDDTDHTVAYFVDQKGHAVAYQNSSPQSDIVNLSNDPAVQRVLRGQSGMILGLHPVHRTRFVTAYTPVRNFGWGAIVAEPESTVFEAREHTLRQLAIFYGLILVLAGISAVFMLLFIKHRRAHERQLRESEALHRRWLNESTDGVWDWNLVTNEEYLSPHFKELFGYTDEELPNHASSWQRIIHPDDLKATLDAFKEHTENGKPFCLPARYFHKNGKIVWVLCRGVAFKNKEGRYVRMLGTHTDISELIHAKEMSRLKDEFIDTVSHELRTPLTVIKEGVSLFHDQVIGALGEEQRGVLSSIEENVNLLSGFIDAVLDLSKIEAGQLHLKKETFNLAAFIKKCVSHLGPVLGHRTIEFQLEPALTVVADAARVRQIISNLLSNAIKFTKDTGTIRIRLESRNGFAVTTIQDDGIGIAQKDIPKLFKKFSQLQENFTQGTGLGLALCKQLTEMHGGVIHASSEPGKGATFTFTLPLPSSSDAAR